MPSTPRTTRALRAAVTAIAAAVFLILAGTTTPAHSATTTPVYAGKGWKAFTGANIYSINPDPYTVVFATTTARTKLTPYFKSAAAQITTITGVKVTVTTLLDTTPTTACPARHRIVVHYLHRPTGAAGVSRALACNQASDRSAWGGHVLMDSEYWTVANWFSTNATVNEAYRKDGILHEFGHIFGLDHPNTDLDKDGVVEPKECVKNTAGVKPVMCAPNRGYTTARAAGRYTSQFDAAGLRQMTLNWYLRQA
ncbi:zinc metalloprotease [Streptomyces bottropensis]|uniref:hypothetical protein n=1 Tax=Streptomyces bottropensis TaxID=42235 RepID=UPI003678813B